MSANSRHRWPEVGRGFHTALAMSSRSASGQVALRFSRQGRGSWPCDSQLRQRRQVLFDHQPDRPEINAQEAMHDHIAEPGEFASGHVRLGALDVARQALARTRSRSAGCKLASVTTSTRRPGSSCASGNRPPKASALVPGFRVTSRSTSLPSLASPRLIEPNTRTPVTPRRRARASNSARWASISGCMCSSAVTPRCSSLHDRRSGLMTPRVQEHPSHRIFKLAAFCVPPSSRPMPAGPVQAGAKGASGLQGG